MQTLQTLASLITARLDVPQSIDFTDTLGDLGLDSFDIIVLVLDVEDHFQIELPETRHPETTTSIAELHDTIQAAQAA
jgi:acyl carrier protein